MAATLATRPSLPQAAFHFLKWLAPLPLVYVAAGAAIGALAGGAEMSAGYGAFIGLTSGVPAISGLWLLDTAMAWLFRRNPGEGWVRGVFWGFGLAAGLMPLLAFLSNNALTSLSVHGDLTGLSAGQQAEIAALTGTVQTTVIALALMLFALALFVSWWNWRAAGAWQKKGS